MKIRRFEEVDWPATWRIIEPVFRAGETYAFPTDLSEEDARHAWVGLPLATFVAIDRSEMVGTYYLKANQPGPGSHISNCGYIVSDRAPSAIGIRGCPSDVQATSLPQVSRDASAAGPRLQRAIS